MNHLNAGFEFQARLSSEEILRLTDSGQILRGDTPIENLSKEQLLDIVKRLVDLLQHRHF